MFVIDALFVAVSNVFLQALRISLKARTTEHMNQREARVNPMRLGSMGEARVNPVQLGSMGEARVNPT